MKKTNSARSAITRALQRPESRFRVLILFLGYIITPQVAQPAESFGFCWVAEVGRSGVTTHFYSAVFQIEPSERTKHEEDFGKYLREQEVAVSPESLCFVRASKAEAETLRSHHEKARLTDLPEEMVAIQRLVWSPEFKLDGLSARPYGGSTKKTGEDRCYFGQCLDTSCPEGTYRNASGVCNTPPRCPEGTYRDPSGGCVPRGTSSNICLTPAMWCPMPVNGPVGMSCYCTDGWSYTYWGQIVAQQNNLR